MRMKIPKSLKQTEKKLLATERDSLLVRFHNEEVELTQSKIGGQPLRFLAQVNFSEMEQTLEDYPDSGLLHFLF